LLRRYIDVWDRDDADFLSVIDRLVELIPRVTREVIEGAAYVPQMTTPERYVEVTTHGVQQQAAL
jgi:hypothetical protein